MHAQPLQRGPALTSLGFGASQFGNLFQETTDEASNEAVSRAWDAGVRYFDTAPSYGLGLSERRLGRALSAYPRNEVVISTKVGRLLVDDPSGAGRQDEEGFLVPATTRRVWDFSRDGIRRSLDASLERLGVDRIDIAYLHDPDDHREAALREGMPALIELREEGVLGAVGAGMNQTRMLTEFIRELDIDVVMVAGRFTLLDHSAAEELLPLALERGVGVVAAGVYNSGLLSRSVVPDDARFNYEAAPADLVDRARRIAAVCAEHGVELPAAAVQFPLEHPAVVSVVLGMRTAAQVTSNVERLNAPLDSGLWPDLVEAGLLPASLAPQTFPRTGA
ncbi:MULTISPECIES: aldo/keto reductase [unclassified Rathayibacter]|uniref:aldo/keto reductase n=1 Tax=unclassified Rathayibacter TaxID=2609250 RepID=UPI000F4C636B|nr:MULTISPECIES: aldo/keto reductase [unclassified Rathayibacter]ROP49171.1 D-threo-aldose 1-dehydrogenase [Rathayibacter sp. PhB186]ROS50712.1 D-threo-aldose 1-dehydrogenase [Rathayibacter sp. PhB185]